MSAWNAKGSAQYASLAAPQTVSAATLQTADGDHTAYASGNISGVRTVTQNPICWKRLHHLQHRQQHSSAGRWRCPAPTSR